MYVLESNNKKRNVNKVILNIFLYNALYNI